jgi:hypothetical protein
VCPRRSVPAPYTPNPRHEIQGALESRMVPSSAVNDVACKRVGERLGWSRKCVEVQVLESTKLIGHFHDGKLTLKRPTNLVHDDR